MQAQHGHRSWFRTDHEAHPASGASRSGIHGRAIPICIQVVVKVDHLRWTGLDAQPASLALIRVNLQRPSILSARIRHRILPPLNQRACRPALQIVRAYRKVFQFRLKSRIGNRNQRFGPFPQRLAVQIGDTVFRHDVVHVRA